MKLAIAAILSISPAAAFAPASKVTPQSSLMASPYENELGVIAPTGFFDPLGLSNDIDEENFAQYRTAELKHGRVAQLAVIGYVVQEIYRFPFDIAPGVPCSSIPNGVAAINAIPALGWAQIFFLIGAVDYYGFLGNFDAGKPELDEEELERRQLSELQHGRIAMLATLELLRHDSQNLVQPGFDGMDHLITGLPFLYN
jgi:Chlorophyll A-B binding protein.